MNRIKSRLGATELACLGKNARPGALGLAVAEILAIVFRGLHHVDPAQLKRAAWGDEHCIAIDFRSAQFATADYNELTQLVVLAHDACVRISVCAPAARVLRLVFHPRQKEGAYAQRHPTLEEAAAAIRAGYERDELIG